MSEREFRACMRMSRASFDRVLSLIGDHPVFQSRGTKPQEPAAVQISLALDHLGHFGNGMGITRLSSQWRRSEGSCINYTNRMLEAILSLEDQYSAWPCSEHRATHSMFMSRKGFDGCVRFVDGTTIPLFQRSATKETGTMTAMATTPSTSKWFASPIDGSPSRSQIFRYYHFSI
ncbi:MAG: hypothetical protein BYD32DRAFT_468819 [Podila humilis]|nr:MAG: hypothetical protein BYD32DRAFT_468819 [Podila humilis]